MVAIEAAAHGLQTVAFAAGGVPDAVMENISGRLIDQGDDDAFAQAVINILSVPTSMVSSENARRFAMGFEWSLFGAKLRLYISKLIESHNCNQK
jgi:phosphatidylinositol alpha-1,6-mannosyltransferase